LINEPYNVKGNYRLASVYCEEGDLELARKHIKRIVIWPSTDPIIKQLYNKLISIDPHKEELKKVYVYIYNIETDIEERIN